MTTTTTTRALARRLPSLLTSASRSSHSGALQPALHADHWSFPDLKPAPSSRGPQWIFLGCPGVGKGTYASRLAKYIGVPHIAMGDLVRDALTEETPCGKKLTNLMRGGKLLPDDMILELLSKRLQRGVESGESGFILDGFPRNRSQAENLDQVASIDLVVNLRLREDILIIKCLGRRICSGCGTSYNIAKIDVEGAEGKPRIFMPPLLPPPSCATKLTVRPDDTEDVVRARLQIYAEESKPVEEYYRAQEKLMVFDVVGGIPETWPKLLAAVKMHLPEEPQSVAA